MAVHPATGRRGPHPIIYIGINASLDNNLDNGGVLLRLGKGEQNAGGGIVIFFVKRLRPRELVLYILLHLNMGIE
jgi:hypothetical protein